MALSKIANVDPRLILAALGIGGAGALGGYLYGRNSAKKEILGDVDNQILLGRGVALRRPPIGALRPGYGRGLAVGPRDGSGIGRYGFCKDGTRCDE